MTVYVVSGRLRYREHDPGSIFEAELPDDVEARALQLGAIRILEDSQPGIQPGTYRPPAGWVTNVPETAT